jgi:rfaE bifunctional protein nucleotidyltransferase chain/domain
MDKLQVIQEKIVGVDQASRIRASWNLKGDKVVFTNGCFDILHLGHVTYLAKAASLGNRLIVGLNTDSSVKRQEKGDDRPINSQDARAQILASLHFVDMVVLFDDDTPIKLIETLLPDVLAKGADYNPDETDPSSKGYIVGSDTIRSSGGEVVAVPLVEGFSTTNLIRAIKG